MYWQLLIEALTGCTCSLSHISYRSAAGSPVNRNYETMLTALFHNTEWMLARKKFHLNELNAEREDKDGLRTMITYVHFVLQEQADSTSIVSRHSLFQLLGLNCQTSLDTDCAVSFVYGLEIDNAFL